MPLLAVAGVVAAPVVMAVLGLVASIVEAIVTGLIVAAVVLVVGWIAKEVLAEVVSHVLTERAARRAQALRAAEQPVYVITDLRRSEAARPVHRAIEPVRVVPTSAERIRAAVSR